LAHTLDPQKSLSLKGDSNSQILTEQEAGYPQPSLYN